ncbi:MAG: hypothetical protein LBI01_00445 [Elusimicrobium sp.]|nr:hypothetical protein [Elusimicrobium sp.]
MLEVMVTNSDGTIKKYESDNFRGKLASKVDVFERPVFNRPLVMPFFGSVNEELFYKTLAKDFTVYIDIKNQKNYFVDISPLYIAAEQK